MSEVAQLRQQEQALSGRSIAEISADIKVHAQNMARSYIAIGRDLTEAKALLGHGRFLPWLKEMGFGVSAANKYMQLAAEIQDDSPLAELPYSKAFALIQLPAGEREAFAWENGVDSKSAAEIKRLIKERDEAQRQAENNRCGRAQAEYEAEVLRQKLKAEQERPAIIQQVVEVPDDYQALKTAAAQHRAEIEEAAQAAEEAEGRAAAAEAELARLRREQSGQGADKFAAFQGAANTFLMAVQLLPYDREEMGSMYNRQRYASLVKGIREWCDEMTVALDDGALSTEGAVV